MNLSLNEHEHEHAANMHIVREKMYSGISEFTVLSSLDISFIFRFSVENRGKMLKIQLNIRNHLCNVVVQQFFLAKHTHTL